MAELTHAAVWAGLDALAARRGLTPSALARLAGLDPTSFNRSKRLSADTPPRPRWPSTESLAKVLAATGVSLAEFAEAAGGGRTARRPARSVPLLGLAQAGSDSFFDDAGLPAGADWDEIMLPGGDDAVCYALEITGDSMAPVYRDGDRIIVQPLPLAAGAAASAGGPLAQLRRGDRVVVRTTGGEVMAKELARLTARQMTLASLNPAYEDRVLDLRKVAAVARILWASQ